MRANEHGRLTWRQASRLLAFASAVVFVAIALGFAILIPVQFEDGNVDGVRWFALSAFPLIVVVWIAVFTRVQRRLDQRHGKQADLLENIEWPYS